MKIYHIVILNCIFLMTSDGDHLFIYFCPFLYLLLRYLYIGHLLIFSLGYLSFLLLSCMNFFHILDVNLLSHKRFVNIFSYSVSFLIDLLIVSFVTQELSSLLQFYFPIFGLLPVLLVSIATPPQNHCVE